MTWPAKAVTHEYDLEEGAKLLLPRPCPIRNELPRLRGEGTARRIKRVTGATGTGTGGATTTQPGITESTTNVGPGGLSFIRPPYIDYTGDDLTFNYVSWGLSDSVSWQAQLQGTGFDDVRSLSATTLLFATMTLDERLMLFGRGTTANGYTGPLAAASVTLAAVSASVAPPSPAGAALAASPFVIVAPDAGDLLGTNGVTMHQGPSTTAASVAVSAGQVIQVNVVTDSPGALGYNLFCASVAAGPYYYAGRTGYNVGYVTYQPTSGPTTTSGAGDSSAVATNFDGLLTSVSANGGYVKRLNAGWSVTNPGSEIQSLLGSIYESVKGDPDQICINGWDRLQLSNAILGGGGQSAYRVFINDPGSMNNVAVGAVVTTVYNEVTGSPLSLTTHPFTPQGNCLVRSSTLPLAASNVSATSYMAMVQDYLMISWPSVQFSYDASVLEIGAMVHVAPAWNGIIQGIAGQGIGVQPPSFGDA